MLTYKLSDEKIQSLSYDYLVLATGLRPRRLPQSIPGYNLHNIFYLRSLNDAKDLARKFYFLIIKIWS